MAPADKRRFIGDLGQELTRRHGKRRYYSPEQIREATVARGYSVDVVCWGYSFFCTPSDFEVVHAAAGETCNYVAMRTEVLADLVGPAASVATDVSSSWLEWPDIDWSSLFDWFDLP